MIPSEEASLFTRKNLRKVTPLEKKVVLEEFFNSLAKLPSHYCRKDTTKLYLEPIINSTSQLYSIYKEYCKSHNKLSLSRFTMTKVMRAMNISIFQPRKDQCDDCCAYKAGNMTENDYAAHIERKNRAREEKNKDKADALQGKCILLAMDVEAVKLAPSLKASALYFKTKLAVHNFTIYNLATHHCTCYWWNETEGDLVASTFASCLLDYLRENCSDAEVPIVVFSDGCGYQNRNAIMANALLRFSEMNGKTVTQKFLERGHTQMECDSVHSAIETKLKNRDIKLPSDYVAVCKEARTKPEPYNTKYITFDFFQDFSKKAQQKYDSIRPGKSTGDPVVTDLRAILYSPDGIIAYKLAFDDEWKNLPRTPKKLDLNANLQPLHFNRIPISERKWKDLQDLKNVLPSDCHSYYDGLPH